MDDLGTEYGKIVGDCFKVMENLFVKNPCFFHLSCKIRRIFYSFDVNYERFSNKKSLC